MIRKTLTIVAALVGLQVVLGGMWWWVEQGRQADLTTTLAPVWEEELHIPLPTLALEHADGRQTDLSHYHGRPLVLHFWATWCPPCVDELPGLLAYAATNDHTVLAVSVDEGWQSIREMLGSELAPALARASSKDIAHSLGVSTLPTTFLVDEDGVIRARVNGPVDWRSTATSRRLGESLNRAR